ncbi:MAG TPA: flagellin, partial [Phycisphaerales bacterium]|nr:flagellin [Phycisphaerales bacterium]
VVEAANTGGVSEDEIAANQLQIDSAIESITRISNTASFAGLQLLNGSLEYLTSGIASSAISGSSIYGVQFGNASTVGVQVEVIASAQTASLFLSGNTTGSVGALQSSVTIELAGSLGVQTLSFISGTHLSAVVAAVNTLKDSTGVSAALVNAGDQSSGLVFNSTAFGSDQFVSVRKIGAGGDFWNTYDNQNGSATQHDNGQDVRAIINGAVATGDGLDVSLNTASLSLKLNLTEDFATRVGTQKSFNIVGGGVNFQLGPNVNATQQVGFGLQSVAASRLGGSTISGVRYFLDSIKSGQSFSLIDGHAAQASQILDSAINDLSTLRGRLGAFERNTIQTNERSIQVGIENITASESVVRDTDFAEETSALSRAQILSSAGTSVLATSNVSSQNVLQLLQGL